MASTFVLTLCLGMLATCLAAPTTKIRWCAKSEPEMKKCRDLSRTCSTDKSSLSCVHKSNTDDCFKAIADGLADVMALDSGDVFRASRHPYNLKPIMAENYGTTKDVDTCYYAVALVKKSSTFMFDDLQGKKSCHTAVGRTAGWILPLYTLIHLLLPRLKESQQLQQQQWAESKDPNKEKEMLQFFSASCAPGAKEEKLCRQCAGQGKEKKCKLSENEPYYGYEGARRCLKDGKGDVAFVKHIIPAEYTKDYELLCTDNTRKPISEYEKCNWGRIPAHSAVSINNEEKIKTITEFLLAVQEKPECKLFSSPHGKDLLVKDSAKSLIPLPSKMDATLYLGGVLANAMKFIHNVLVEPPQDRIRWCTQSKEEKSKCDTWAIASEGAIECVEASLAEECIAKILKGDADAVTLDGGYLYTAGACGLVPAMGEIYDAAECRKTGTTPGTYYAVAVVKASDTDISWNNLEGKLSCHTAVGRTAGWVIPIGLIHKKTGICDMSTFFKASCAPGADVNSNLCKLCAGDPQKSIDGTKCSANNQELYYGYHGAFRCLVEQGQVAFVKHTTASEVVKDNAEWLGNKKLEDFRLLCRDGSVKPLSESETCHLAKVPAHAVATLPSRKDDVVRILKDQQSKFGRKNDKSAQMFSMFNSEGRRDQLFKDSTQCLREITVPMNEFLGPDYTEAVSSLNNCTQSEMLQVCTFHSCKL